MIHSLTPLFLSHTLALTGRAVENTCIHADIDIQPATRSFGDYRMMCPQQAIYFIILSKSTLLTLTDCGLLRLNENAIHRWP